MNSPYTIDQSDIGLDRAVMNRTLRNTYALLALSLIPTILGAWLGVTYQIGMGLGRGMHMILFFAGAFGLMYLVNKNKNNSMGVVFLLAFTFFMGIMLTGILTFVLRIPNGAAIVMYALGGTAAIFGVMSFFAFTVKRDLSFMYKGLMIGLIVLILASVANIFLKMPALHIAISSVSMLVFSAFLLVDLQRVVRHGETNYISATLAIYLDLYNLFVNLLSILSMLMGDRR